MAFIHYPNTSGGSSMDNCVATFNKCGGSTIDTVTRLDGTCFEANPTIPDIDDRYNLCDYVCTSLTGDGS